MIRGLLDTGSALITIRI
ncbi:hypothetical protein Aduo_000376 [Ancylostoma duodenale]